MKHRFLVAFFGVAALTSCAAPQPIFKPVTVEVPVAQNLNVAPPPKPDFALARVAASDDLFLKAKAALEEIEQRRAYEAQLESQLYICHN